MPTPGVALETVAETAQLLGNGEKTAILLGARALHREMEQ